MSTTISWGRRKLDNIEEKREASASKKEKPNENVDPET
jgi:hypothetical protein